MSSIASCVDTLKRAVLVCIYLCVFFFHFAVRRPQNTVKKGPVGGSTGQSNDSSMMLDSEAAVIANFEFLSGQDMDVDDLEDLETKQASNLAMNQGKKTYLNKQ